MRSTYYNVTEAGTRFKVQLARKGKMFYFGTFDFEKDAGKAADRAALLLAPWSQRAPLLNFTDSKAPAPEEMNESERAAFEFLTTHFREDLAASRREDRISEYVPDVVLEAIRDARVTLDAQYKKVAATLEEAARVMRYNAQKMEEQEKNLEWHRLKVIELEDTIRNFNGTKHMRDGDGKFVFKPVTPGAPHVPEESVLPKPVELPTPFTAPSTIPVGAAVEHPSPAAAPTAS